MPIAMKRQSASPMIKLLIADDHQIVRAGIRALLLGSPDILVVAEVSSAQLLLDVVSSTSADVLLLDLVFPDGSGLDLIRPVQQAAPALNILVLSSEMEEDVVCEAVSRGATGFLHKDASSAELVNAIHCVAQGEPYFGQCISHIIYKSYSRHMQAQAGNDNAMISHREKQVISLLAEGLSFKDVAEKLFISPRTVENHKSNILHKLGLRNTIELLRYAIKHRIIEL